MKTIAVFVAIIALSSAADECYKDIYATCANTLSKQPGNLISKCDSKYGAIDNLQHDLQRFTNNLLFRSFDFLLLSTHYGNYIKNRPGFEKLFRGLSDDLWQDGIDTIKYITKRGGQMNFNNIPAEIQQSQGPLELYELHALGKALDVEKQLAKEAFEIHKTASGKTHEHHDPEVAHHLEEKFMEKHRDTIRTLAGHTRDLSSMLDGPDASLSLYLFDEYLQK
ncbi:soma ferritin [Anthonomus grandis grandis]|uniref:soma ferritin n=1 Tax=Anthonomus grandis grandis TaxID=2921223 RepID=UPI0021652D6F|nr:soma ferritin [Anthonomus grandis grandis]XP_050302170.1 soma ferritin [Anthonomus grandis grandis]